MKTAKVLADIYTQGGQSRLADSKRLAAWRLGQVEQYLVFCADPAQLADLPECADLPSWQIGTYRLVEPVGLGRLTLFLGDTASALADLLTSVDAWFLAAEPSVLVAELMAKRTRRQNTAHNNPRGRVALEVNAALWPTLRPYFADNGELKADYRPQFGHRVRPLDGWIPAWLDMAQPFSASTKVDAHKNIIVIGAGIAGASTAAALAERGFAVTVLEAKNEAAQGGSGNPQGMLYVQLSPSLNSQTQLLLSALPWALRQIARYLGAADGDNWQACPLKANFTTDKETHAWTACLLEQFPNLFRPQFCQLQADGLLFLNSAWVHPPAWVRRLLAHERITVHYGAAATDLAWSPVSRRWTVTTANGAKHSASKVVIANAEAANNFSQTRDLPLQPMRGQINEVLATPASLQQATILCGHSYIAPARLGRHTLGASFTPHDSDKQVRPEDTAANLLALKQLNAAWFHQINGEHLPAHTLAGRASLRAVTPDYLPLVGGVARTEDWLSTYAKWGQDGKLRLTDAPPMWPNLYINAGHGTRGLVTAPWAAECLADVIQGQPVATTQTLWAAIHPQRFLLRRLVKGSR
jgi:tRNA 5-methylaminomethyl-2-thiouridine biosynthesis bifunctional protein